MPELYERYASNVIGLLSQIVTDEQAGIRRAGELIAESVMNGGILQAFGSGHSYAAAVEICDRAGGLLPAKVLREPSFGEYERIEGVGRQFCDKVDVQSNDVAVVVSTSGRNPMVIEIAGFFKEAGVPVIAVTSLAVSKGMTSRHSSGKMLYELADVVLDTHGELGDAIMEVPGLPEKAGATSSFTSMLLLDCAVLHSMTVMLDHGFTPPVLRSRNVDGGMEANEQVEGRYGARLKRF